MKQLLISIFIISFAAFSDVTNSLEFDKILFNRDKIELSALHMKGNDLLFVGDKLSNRAIYKISFEKDRFYYSNYIDLAKLKGHDKYFAKALLLKHGGRLLKSPFDLEGVTSCDQTFYLVNEQVRHVLKVEDSKISNMKIKFKKAFKKTGYPLKKISRNAGFEGIAADCKNQKLYIAQERSPRGIIKIDIKSAKVEETFLFSDDKTVHGSNDYADLHFENGFLYLLERNEHVITKYDVKNKKVVFKYSFEKLDGLNMRDLYSTGEIYGLAEGLYMSDDRIYLGLDNNKKPLSKLAQKKYGIKGKFSSIVIFKRPKDF